jgi:hypothetical protein
VPAGGVVKIEPVGESFAEAVELFLPIDATMTTCPAGQTFVGTPKCLNPEP